MSAKSALTRLNGRRREAMSRETPFRPYAPEPKSIEDLMRSRSAPKDWAQDWPEKMDQADELDDTLHLSRRLDLVGLLMILFFASLGLIALLVGIWG